MRRALATIVALLSVAASAVCQSTQVNRYHAEASAAPSRQITAAQARQAIAEIEAADLPEKAIVAFTRLVRTVGPGFVPPGISKTELSSEAICAKVVSSLFWQAFGREDNLATARGVSGNAWDMAINVSLFGGRVFPWNTKAPPPLRPGDILGIHYAESIYNGVPKPVDYTHLALVIAVTPSGGALIVHSWAPPMDLFPPGTARPWPIRIEFLNNFISHFHGLFEVRAVMIPRDTTKKGRRPPGVRNGAARTNS